MLPDAQSLSPTQPTQRWLEVSHTGVFIMEAQSAFAVHWTQTPATASHTLPMGQGLLESQPVLHELSTHFIPAAQSPPARQSTQVLPGPHFFCEGQSLAAAQATHTPPLHTCPAERADDPTLQRAYVLAWSVT